MVSPRKPIFRRARCQACEHQQNEQKNYTATEDPDMTCLASSLLIDEPFQQQNDTCTNQHSWPPSAIPLEGLSPGDSAYFSQEEHHANTENDQRPNNGSAAKAASLSS
jgi:hypothetical protein